MSNKKGIKKKRVGDPTYLPEKIQHPSDCHTRVMTKTAFDSRGILLPNFKESNSPTFIYHSMNE
jgi:hypothetical protein